MIKYLLTLLPILAMASNIEISHSIRKLQGKVVHTNAQITQLSNQKQEIVSRLAGHVEKFYVKAGEHVNTGDKVALVKSIALSKLSADYLAFKTQMNPVQRQLESTKKLYKKGLTSKNVLTSVELTLETLRSQKNALASQLHALDIDAQALISATDNLILYAHAEGIVGKIHVSLHSSVDAQTPLMTLVQNNGYYATAFLAVRDAMQVNKKTKGNIIINKQVYSCHFVQLLPTIDEETQRAKVRFAIEDSPKNLLLGAFSQIDITLPSQEEVVMIKKSALTLYQGEWVVFIAEDREATHNDEGQEAHKHENEIHEEDIDRNHEHDAHEKKVSYKVKVVEIITYNGNEVAIVGLEAGEKYVSDGVYFVKSMLLKSSLGEHGH